MHDTRSKSFAESPASLLPPTDTFPRRHLGPDAREIATMLAVIEKATLDELINSVVPASIRMDRPLSLPAGETPT